MLSKTIKTVAVLVAAFLGAINAEPVGRQQCKDLEKFINKQDKISIAGVLANIGTDGSKAEGVPAGIVVASPSKSDPDCMPRPEHCETQLLTNSS